MDWNDTLNESYFEKSPAWNLGSFNVFCWLVSKSFPLLLSQYANRTLIRLNEQLQQWKILTPFMYFELTIVCISASLAVSSVAHAHNHPATRSATMKNTSNPKALASSMKRFFTFIWVMTITLLSKLRITYSTM